MAKSVNAEFVRNLLEQGALSLPDACKAIRQTRGLTQDELAMRAGVNRKVVKDLERGKGNPRWESLLRIGRAAGLRIAFVIDDGEVRILDARKRLAEEEAQRAADSAALQHGLSSRGLHARNAMGLGGVKLRLPKIA